MADLESTQNYFFMMLGAPGSGKSYVSDWLTPKFRALRLRSDDMRVAMLGTLRPEFHEEPYSSMINGAMLYAAKQALIQNHSVVYDTNSNSIGRRNEWSEAAKQAGALPVIVWVHTPLNIAKERAIIRDKAESDGTSDTDYIEIMASKIETPVDGELVIDIDGQETTEQQQTSFNNQIEKLK